MIESLVESGKNPHLPIMVEEVIQYLQVSKNGTYIDCTIGYGGHARHILERLSPNGKLIGIDKDEEAIKFCKKSLSAYSNVQLFHNSYHKIKDILSVLEPRINQIQVQIEDNIDANEIAVTVNFNIAGVANNESVDFYLERLR